MKTKAPETNVEPPGFLQPRFSLENCLLSGRTSVCFPTGNTILSRIAPEREKLTSLKTPNWILDTPSLFKLNTSASSISQPKLFASTKPSVLVGSSSQLESSILQTRCSSVRSLQTPNRLLFSSTPSSSTLLSSKSSLEFRKPVTSSNMLVTSSPLTSMKSYRGQQSILETQFGGCVLKPKASILEDSHHSPLQSETARKAASLNVGAAILEDPYRSLPQSTIAAKDVEAPEEEEVVSKEMPAYSLLAEHGGGDVEPVQELSALEEEIPECRLTREEALQKKKMSLINLVCGSLVNTPKLTDQADPTRLDLVTSSREIADYDPEFILKVALYTRQELNIRMTGNFLLALGAWLPACRPHLRRYFCATVQLPSDWMEVPKLFQSLAGSGGRLAPLPSCLRRSMADKFKEFDEYQLAKYNTRKQRGKHGKKQLDEETAGEQRAKEVVKRVQCLQAVYEGFQKTRKGNKQVASESRSCDSVPEAAEEDNMTRRKKGPEFTLKKLIGQLHIKEPVYHVMCLLGRRYPSDITSFSRSHLPGPWDPQLARKRMKLSQPETWERLLCLHGNVAHAWEELIDHKKLPFMAMLRNLRNMIQVGISPAHHEQILKKLTSQGAVIRSRQFPFRFLSAYKVITSLEVQLKKAEVPVPPNTEILRQLFKKASTGNRNCDWKIKKHNWTRRELLAAMAIPAVYRMLMNEKRRLEKRRTLRYDQALLDRYRQALDLAVQISADYNLPPLPGRTVIMCSVCTHMKKCCHAAKGLHCLPVESEEGKEDDETVRSITVLHVSLLLSLMLMKTSEDAQLILYNYSDFERAQIQPGSILKNMEKILQQAKDLNQEHDSVKNCREIPHFLLDYVSQGTKFDRLLVFEGFSVMESLEKAVMLYRCQINPRLLFFSIFPALTNRSYMKPIHPNDVVLYGFSDQILKFVAERGSSRLLDHVEKMDKVHGIPEPEGKVMKHRPAEAAVAPLWTAPKLRWRCVRVFISSTFRDMHGERDLLIRCVFPELQARAARHFLCIQEVDLRWGITEEETRSNRQLELCLSEVFRCQLFLGILGERYGHVPEDYTLPKLPQFEWVQDYPAGASVTELEAAQFLQQNDNSAKGKAFFYLRDPAVLRSVPEKWMPDFAAESEQARARMAGLKNQVRENGLLAFDSYSCEWGGVAHGNPYVKGLEEFANRVLGDLWAAILNQFCQVDLDSEADAEVTLQEAFHESQRRLFIGRHKLLLTTAAEIQGKKTGGLFVISGGPSEGKTTFVAALAQELAANWTGKSKKASSSSDVICHFIGASQSARNVTSMLTRLCQTLSQRVKAEGAIPTSYRGLVGELRCLVESASSSLPRRSLILLIDGADCLQTHSGQLTSDWIPEHLPKGVILVLSVTTESSLLRSLAQRRDTTFLTLGQLERPDKSEIIRKTLASHGKKLEESAFNNQMRLLLAKKESHNPLYLKLASEELRAFGVFEKVSERIQALPPTLRLLVQRVLSSLEEEHGADLVTYSLTTLYLSRTGLREQDLHALLSMCKQCPPGSSHVTWQDVVQAGRSQEKLVPMATFAAWLRSLRWVMGVWTPAEIPGSRLCLSNSHLRLAVEQRYVKKTGMERTTHLLIAGYLWRLIDPTNTETFHAGDPEALRDLPYHLVCSEELNCLSTLLTNLHFLHLHARLGLLSHLLETYSFYATSVAEVCSGGAVSRATVPLSEVECYRDFISQNASVLSQNPSLFWQQVLNQPDTSAVFLQAQSLMGRDRAAFQLAGGDGQVSRIVKWLNKPQATSKLHSKATPIPSAPTSVSISPRGHLAAVGTSLGYVHLLDTDSGQEVRSLVSSCDGISACEFLSDTLLCGISFDGKMEVWNVLDGCRLLQIEGHTDRISGCAVSPDKKQFATVSWDCKLKVWRANKGTLDQETMYPYPLNCVTFHPEGHLIAVGCWDASVRVWNCVTAKKRSVLRGHKASVREVSYRPSGEFLVSASLDGQVLLWSVISDIMVGSYTAHRGASEVAKFIGGGQFLVTAGEDQKVRVWSGSLGQSCGVYGTGVSSAALCVCVRHEAKQLAIGYHSDGVKIYNASSGNQVAECQLPQVPIRCLMWLQKGDLLASGSDDQVVRVWQVSGSRQATCVRMLAGHLGPVLALDLSNDFLASASDDFTVMLWSLKEVSSLSDASVQSPAAVLRGHSAGVTCCSFSPDGQGLVTGGKDRNLLFWDVGSLPPSMSKSLLSCHLDWISGCCWTEQFVASCSSDCTVRLWDPQSGECLECLLGHQSAVSCVCVKGGYVLSASSDGNLRVWRPSGTEVTSFLAHSTRINHCVVFKKFGPCIPDKQEVKGQEEEKGIALPPEELMVASASDDGTVRVWCPLLTEEVCTLMGHSAPICAAATQKNLPFAVTVSEDHSLRMWDIPLEKAAGLCPHHGEAVSALAWSYCGNFLISGSMSGELIAWHSRKPVCRVQASTETIAAITFTSQTRFLVASGSKLSSWKMNYLPTEKSIRLELNNCHDMEDLVTTLTRSSSWKQLLVGGFKGHLAIPISQTLQDKRFLSWTSPFQFFETADGRVWAVENRTDPLLYSLEFLSIYKHDFTRQYRLKPWSSQEEPAESTLWLTAVKPLDSVPRLLCSDSEGALWIPTEDEPETSKEESQMSNSSSELLFKNWRKLQAHRDQISALHVTSAAIITASHDCTVKLWDRTSFKQVALFYCSGPVTCLEPRPSSPWEVVCGDKMGNVYFLNCG
ncbi:telomerase protein component 1-like [Latimeria chalumnae]|uniref:telomerase protein component 1-like n=1 Tax=Latimeria chalumnae TaxID=7897 RepID=UPI00313C9246